MLNRLRIVQNLTLLRLCLISTNLLIIITGIYFYRIYSSNEKDENNNENDIGFIEDEMTCHYLEDEGAISPLNDLVKFQPNSIFFIESSCQGLTSREACSVESAARANPNKQVIVLFTSPVSWDNYKSSALPILLGMPNVEAARLHIEEYAKGTPLHKILFKKPLSRDDINMKIGDVLKFLTIYKYSGIYLGLDVLVARPLTSLKDNWIVKESPATISTQMFAFSNNKHGRSLADFALNIVLSELELSTRQDMWTFDNNNIMKQLVSMWCRTNDILVLDLSACKDLQVHEPDLFIPIAQYDRQKYFLQGEWSLLKNETIYTFYSWSYLTKYNMVPKNSLYDKLAQKYCPGVFEFYGVQFGLV